VTRVQYKRATSESCKLRAGRVETKDGPRNVVALAALIQVVTHTASSDAQPTIYVATIMRATGETGVQTHFNSFLDYIERDGGHGICVTPFMAPSILVYPIFAFRRLIDLISSTLSVQWYRYWHGRLLQHVLARHLRREARPVVIYAQCPVSAHAALRARRSARQSIVMVVHFNVSQADEWAGKGKLGPESRAFRRIRQFERLVLSQLDGIVYVSEFSRRVLETRIPALATRRSTMLPNFVTLPKIDSFGSSIGRADLVNIGTLESRKNQAYLLEILAMAAAMGHRYELTVIGQGPDRVSLEQYAEELGVRHQVHFLGFRRDAARLILGHRLYCHVATMENFGFTLLEAMSYGVPVASADVGGTTEVFDDGVEGFTWPLDAAHTAASILVQHLEDGDRLAAMGSAARQRVADCFTTDVVASRLLRFLLGRDLGRSDVV